jgi:hypothetical protein
MQEKKEWQNPELIVLVRGRPEEAVLTPCKSSSVAGGSGDEASGCNFYEGACGACYDVYLQS